MSEVRTTGLSGTDEPTIRQASAGKGDSSVLGTKLKICSVCGLDLMGRTRFKDTQGLYWCNACNDRDQASKEPASCPDCQVQFTKADLLEFKGTPVCKDCWEKRRQATRREESRIRGIEEEVQEEKKTLKRWTTYGIALAVILVLWGIIWLIYWLMARHAAS